MKLKRRKANNEPLPWSITETELLLTEIRNNGFNSLRLLNLFPKRTLPSIRSKVRKLRINLDFFGDSYRVAKEKFTQEIANKAKPKKVFEAYAGAGHQTFKWIESAEVVFAADNIKSKLKQFRVEAKKNGFIYKGVFGKWRLFQKGEKEIFYFTGDAVKAAAELNSKDVKIDTIDLDTCGSTLPTLSYFLLMLKPKHLIITHGEFHSMRFKREDVLRRLFLHRDVNKNPLPLSVDKMSKELDKAVKIAGLRSHNDTTRSFWPILKKEVWLGGKFHGMLRRYYKISKPKATADSLNYLAIN